MNDQIKPSLEQDTAINHCMDMSEPIVGVTGGAGTGKTLVLGFAYSQMKKQYRTVLCAPTGRAAKRIEELTGNKAKTVHRLLEFPMPDEYLDETEAPNEPRRNRQRPLDERVVFVDESSMISPILYRQLMDALPKNGVVRFFGDNNQLPPVETDDGKAPFMDILERFPSVELTFNFRNEDAIIGNALRILRGSVPLRNPQFEIIYSHAPIKTLLEFTTPDFAFDNCQIITPTRRGNYGTQRINPSLQAKLNKAPEYMRLDRYEEKEPMLTVRPGDKWLWIKNDYKLNMFNGEIGRIDWIDNEDGSLGLSTADREITVPPRCKVYNPYAGVVVDYDPRKQIELGYAVTTHKSQGSEFDTVVYCMTSSAPFLLSKRNFYTAITRARKLVIVITDMRAMRYSMTSGRK